MRILQVNKFYRMVGGSERYLFNLSQLLQAHGHEVIPFAMAHPDNVVTPYAAYFVDRIEYYQGSPAARAWAGLKALPRIIWYREAARRMAALVRDTKPDLAHLHMIDHQISPSILPVLASARVPIVLTAHQYKLVCPNYRLLNERTGMLCERCLSGNYWHPLFTRCHKGSLISSAALAVEMVLHKRLKVYERHVDLIHVPSKFMGEKLVEGGIPRSMIRHADLVLDPDQFQYSPNETGQGLVYFGRLSAEKGIGTLLRAMKGISDLPLTIIGGGPLLESLGRTAREMGLFHVTFTGPLHGEALLARIRAAVAVVLPSEWYENSPLVIYEAFALGRPVIGARIGGIPEYVEPGVTGFLFRPGDVDDLRRAISDLRRASPNLMQMQRRARRVAEERFSPEVHYRNMLAIYEEAIARRSARHA